MSSYYTKNNLKKAWQRVYGYLPHNRWARRALLGIGTAVILSVGGMYGVAQWYIHSQSKPQTIGVSFIPQYAQYLGVDPHETLDSLLGIGVKQLRLVSYWDAMEPTPGQYDFSQLDWQFQKAESAGAKISLSLGLRQPRWPECHAPSWVDTTKPASQWQPQLEQYMTAVVNRYKDSPALSSYQIENEYFLKGFGLCNNFDRGRLISEYNLVKKLDPSHPLVVNRSNNGIGIPLNEPKPDEYGISIYKRVWDAGITHRYLEYPFPAWYYAFLAGAQKIHDGRDMRIHELQAEAWAPNGKELPALSLDEQNKSFNAQRFQGRIDFGKATGMRHIDLWGAEYWYYRLKVLHDPTVWDIAKSTFKQS
jgi:hypothetical protein